MAHTRVLFLLACCCVFGMHAADGDERKQPILVRIAPKSGAPQTQDMSAPTQEPIRSPQECWCCGILSSCWARSKACCRETAWCCQAYCQSIDECQDDDASDW